jgi:hypothetical protein
MGGQQTSLVGLYMPDEYGIPGYADAIQKIALEIRIYIFIVRDPDTTTHYHALGFQGRRRTDGHNRSRGACQPANIAFCCARLARS